jgi:hypothetical protein
MTVPQVIVDIGFVSPTVSDTVFVVGDPLRGKLGGTGLLGTSDIWTDVTAYVRSWSVRRGASRGDDPTLRYEPGTATVEFNDGDRRFDPENLSGPYVLGGVTQVEPMRRVRIRAIWNGITYPIFVGYADDWQPSYQGNSWTYTTLTATDAEKVFAANDRSGGGAVGAGEDAGARVTRILDGVGWSAADRNIDVGDTLLQSTTLAGNTLTELLLVQDTELGEFYIDASGRATFRNRRAMLTEARSSTSQAEFGDGGYVATGEIPYADAQPSTGDEGMANTVLASAAGGTQQIAQDSTSVSRYLIKTHTRDDLLLQTDAEALNWANAIKYQYAYPARRFATLEFNTPALDVDDVHWPQVLGREFGDRITVNRRPAGGGTITRDCFIRGVTHESDGAYWRTSWILQSAARYSFFVVGDPVLGVLGSNALAY